MRIVLPGLTLLAFTSRVFADEPITGAAPVAVPTPAPISTPAPLAAPASEAVSDSVSADLPLRLRDMLRLESDRARTARYFSGTLGIACAGGVVALGALSLANADPNDSFRKDYSYLILASGGIAVISAFFGLIGQTPIERLYESYAPFAVDTKFPAEQRLREGEDALRQMAASDASSRRISGITGLVMGAVIGGFAIWAGTTSELDVSDRTVLGGLLGVSSLVALGSAMGQLWFQRGPAEVALEHWEAARGFRHEARLVPMFAPMVGGATGGISVLY